MIGDEYPLTQFRPEMGRSELCKSCIHSKVCMKTKNILGNVFVPGNPILFDNEKLWAEYKKWEEAGFPCGDYMEVDE